ncbi:MAG: site-specific integrase [Lachnospiraceae bacterium]|nr:site-specific integrase [Lachnospiraceae bacterium]
MASFAARKNKKGEIISYQIKVSRGRDSATGKQLTPYTMTFKPSVGMSKKAVERQLYKVMGEFEAACARGEVSVRKHSSGEPEEGGSQTVQYRKNVTFSEYIDIFIREKRVSLSPVTITNYRRELNKAAEQLGGCSLSGIDFLRMKKYMTDMQDHATNRRTGRQLETQTIGQHYVVLHSFFENAVENRYLSENPMNRIKRPRQKKQFEQKKTSAYNESQVKYIIEALNKEPVMWRAMMMFAIDSGCRCGEIMGLKWSEIDLATGRVNICRNIQYTSTQGIFVSTPKNRKNREIFLNHPVIAVLRKWKKEQDRMIRKGLTADTGYCFTKKDGNVMIPGAFNSYLKRFGRKYGLPDIHPHVLRHTMATISIANGADIVSVSKKLGHANISITLNVYSHANEEAQKRANEVLAKAIWKPRPGKE